MLTGCVFVMSILVEHHAGWYKIPCTVIIPQFWRHYTLVVHKSITFLWQFFDLQWSDDLSLLNLFPDHLAIKINALNFWYLSLRHALSVHFRVHFIIRGNLISRLWHMQYHHDMTTYLPALQKLDIPLKHNLGKKH